jgi:ribokinase
MPLRGETILGGGYQTGPGGKGANQAVAAARLNADVTMVVSLGADDLGNRAEQNLVHEGIHPDYILRTDVTHTGVAFIIVDDDGENMIVVAPGANDVLRPEDVEAAREMIAASQVLLVQLEVPLETVACALRIAHEAGVRTLLNPAPGQTLSPDLLQLVDVLTPNETEAQIISGHAITGLTEAEAAARSLLDVGVGCVVVTLGGNGALIVSADGTRHIPGRHVEVVDTTGAGDAFSGALAVAIAEGRSIVDAVTFANAAAALQVTKVGTAPAMPYRPEVEAFLERGPTQSHSRARG